MDTPVNTTGEDAIQALFERQLDVGLQHGAQLVVYDGTDRVIDLAGGVTGPDGAPTTPETKHLIWSCTKPYAATCVHQLVEAGELDYDDPGRRPLAGFTRGDDTKADVTVRHVLSHQTGMPTSELDDDPKWMDRLGAHRRRDGDTGTRRLAWHDRSLSHGHVWVARR